MPNCYEIVTDGDGRGASVIVRDEHGEVVTIVEAMSTQHARQVAVGSALIIAKQPGVVVVFPEAAVGTN